MNKLFRVAGVIPILVILLSAVETHAAASSKTFEISGWVPYWRKATGTPEAIAHIDVFKEINPFGYTVKEDGTLFDAMEIDQHPWTSLVNAARAKKVRVIPTVMWSNTDAIHAVLKSPKSRKAHIAQIMKMVTDHNFDGVDIDYEGKKAATRPYFSLFLKELYAAMGKKWVMCTIEARTPLDSRYDTIPKDIEYANDYAAINKYCDRVRLMAYDQGSIDLKLNRAAPGPYVPVADPKWVEKVVNLTAKTIPKKKIIIGIPTYGYEYEMTPLKEGYRYDLLWAFNPKYALDLAATLGILPGRNAAGEKSFAYMATPAGVPIAHNSLGANVASAATPDRVVFRILWWSDAAAIKDKVALAKKLGVRGVAIFKIDGGADPGMWDALR